MRTIALSLILKKKTGLRSQYKKEPGKYGSRMRAGMDGC